MYMSPVRHRGPAPSWAQQQSDFESQDRSGAVENMDTPNPSPSKQDSNNKSTCSVGEADYSEVFLAGFRDCTMETLTYLIQVEKMAMDDPIILNLRQHLSSKQHRIESQPSSLNTSFQGQTNTDSFEQMFDLQRNISFNTIGNKLAVSESDEGYLSLCSDIKTRNSSTPVKSTIAWDSSSSTMTTPSSTDCTVSSVSTDESMISSASPATAEQSAQSQEQAEQVLELAMLAQNHPDIANITKEILALFEEEELEGDEECDDDVNNNDVEMDH